MTCSNPTDVASYEVGFGSPSLSNEFLPEILHDHGFGAPSSVSYLDVDDVEQCFRNTGEEGFGDPFRTRGFKRPPRINKGTGVEFSDNGGQLGVVFADFEQAFSGTNFGVREPIGPFSIYIENETTGETGQCFSAIPGQGSSLFTTTNQDKLYFALPFTAKGSYKFLMQWNDDGVLKNFDITNAIKILHRQRNDKTMSVRANLPDFWNAGPRSDNYNSPDLYIPDESNCAVLTSMIGEVFNHLWFNDYTITTSQYTTDQTVLNVESTLGFPDVGFFIVDGLKVKYTGKTDTSFTGISGIDKIIHPTARVHFDHQEVSEIDNYWKIQNNQLYKPAYVIDDVSWLKAFNAIEFGEHVCWTVLFDYYKHLFNVVSKKFQVLVTAGGLITPINSNVDNTLITNPVFLNRLIEIDNKVFYTRTLSGSGQNIVLDRPGCTYWNGYYENADLNKPRLVENQVYEATIYPWQIKKDQDGEFIFDLEESSLPSATGFIDHDFIDFNIYFGGSEIGPETDLNLNKLLAAGIKGFVTRSLSGNSAWPVTFPSFPNPTPVLIEPDNVFDDQAP